MNSKLKKFAPLIISIIVLVIIALASILFFYKEKILVDTGYRVFYMINADDFCFSNNRYILILNQLIPLLLYNASYSLKIIIQTLTISDILFYTIGALISHFLFKQYFYTLIFPLGYVFMFGYIYFHIPDNEIHLQTAFIYILGLWYISGYPLTITSWVGIFITLIIILLGHPIGIPSSIALVGLIWLRHPLSKLKTTILLLLILCLAFLRWYIQDAYETSVINNINSNAIFSNMSEKFNQILFIIKTHPFFTLFFFFLSIRLFQIQKYKELILISAFILLNFSLLFTQKNGAYFEPYLVPLSGVLLIMTFKNVLQPLYNKQPIVTISILILFFITEISAIAPHYKKYHQKVQFVESLIQKSDAYPKNQRFLYDNNIDSTKNFESSFEYASSMLLSTLNGKSKVFIPTNSIPNSIGSILPFLDTQTKEVLFPDSTNIHSTAQLIHYANIFYNEEYKYINAPQVWFSGQLNEKYFKMNTTEFIFLK